MTSLCETINEAFDNLFAEITRLIEETERELEEEEMYEDTQPWISHND